MQKSTNKSGIPVLSERLTQAVRLLYEHVLHNMKRPSNSERSTTFQSSSHDETGSSIHESSYDDDNEDLSHPISRSEDVYHTVKN